MPYLRSNDAQLYYSIDGQGEPIILLHCCPADRRILSYQSIVLSSTFKTISMDFRGLGLSQKTTDPCTIEMLSDDVANLMDEEKIDSAMILGISIGGCVAQRLAVEHPEKVRALVVSGTNCTSQTDVLQKKFAGRIQGYRSDAAGSYYEYHLRSIFSEEFLSSSLGSFALSMYLSQKQTIKFESIARLFEALKDFHLGDEIRSISSPTLVIEGDHDSVYKESEEVARLIRGSKFAKIVGAGHAACFEYPVVFNQFLLPFVSGVANSNC